MVSGIANGLKSQKTAQKTSFWAIFVLVSAFLGALAMHEAVGTTILLGALGAAFLIVLSYWDIKYRRIPARLLTPALILLLTFRAFFAPATLPDAILGGLLGWALFWLLARLGDGDLGGGDVKLAGLVGVLTGLTGVIPALLLGMAAGGVMAAILLADGRAKLDDALPYAPAMSLGAISVMLWILL